MERVRALRGATTLDADDRGHLIERTSVLLREMMERNKVDPAELVSIVFTATDDLHSEFPAAAARSLGISNIPLLCARELDVTGSVERCIRVLMTFHTTLETNQLRHVYLERAEPLRFDLPE